MKPSKIEKKLRIELKYLKKKIKQLSVNLERIKSSNCYQCFEKQKKLDSLEEENIILKQKLRHQERTSKEGCFLSSTPSSQIPFKTNATEKNKNNNGGAKAGHKGNGRKIPEASEMTNKIEINTVLECPRCKKNNISKKKSLKRTVIDIIPVIKETNEFTYHQCQCEDCGKIFTDKVPGVLPKALFSNQLLTYLATEHYLNGVTLGRLSKQLALNKSSIINALHNLADIFNPVIYKLIKDYRKEQVRHADETGWRNNGFRYFVWLFCSISTSIYRIRNNRSSKVPKKVFGSKKLNGVLVVDRYAAYNKLLVALQYCYAHILRTIEDLLKEFPEEKEIIAFANAIIPLISKAMHIHNKKISNKSYYKQAKSLKRKIMKIIKHSAVHPGIHHIQDIFRDYEHRLFHWVSNKNVPAHNNFAERELRPSVISRKLSFGSQSDKGCKTRETLMSILHTLKKRNKDVFTVFKFALDCFALNPKFNLYSVFKNDST